MSDIHKSEIGKIPESPKDLALSFLGREKSRLGKELTSLNQNLSFQENYKPGPTVSRPSYVEAGSMDASDWDIAEYETEHWEEDRDDNVSRLEIEIEDQHRFLEGLSETKDEIVQYNNHYLIEHFASLEKEYIRKQKEREQK